MGKGKANERPIDYEYNNQINNETTTSTRDEGKTRDREMGKGITNEQPKNYDHDDPGTKRIWGGLTLPGAIHGTYTVQRARQTRGRIE